MRPSSSLLLGLGLGAACLALLLVLHPRLQERGYARRLAAEQELVAKLGLTDPCLTTEARYTRHPSQADIFAPFQEYPGALEHFPTGSIIRPPKNLGRRP